MRALGIEAEKERAGERVQVLPASVEEVSKERKTA